MEVISSRGKKFTDPFIYLGTGGNILMYYRLYLSAVRTQQKEKADEYLAKALESFQLSVHIMKNPENACENDPNMAPSFFMGPAGIYTMGAIIYMHVDGPDAANVKKYVAKVLSMEHLYKEENQGQLEDEILYGSAGYLYCLLLLKDKLGLGGMTGFTTDFNRIIHKVVEAIMIQGVDEKRDYLEFYFPRKKKKAYLGAAHGTIGIIYMLIKALQISPEL